jgi:Domain of unknown function (DUF6458)
MRVSRNVAFDLFDLFDLLRSRVFFRCIHEPDQKEDGLMRIGSSLVLIAVGAILKFAVTASVSGIKLSVVGVVLMVVGVAGLVISVVLANTARRTDVVHHSAREGYTEPPRSDPPRSDPRQ